MKITLLHNHHNQLIGFRESFSILSEDFFAFLLEYLILRPPEIGTYLQPVSFGIDNPSPYNYLKVFGSERK